MLAPPSFLSISDYSARLTDIEFWQPFLQEALGRHDLVPKDDRCEPTAGEGGTYPTFVVEELVVKLFGYNRFWEKSYQAESAAHEALKRDKTIKAPELLASGQLFEDTENPWPYIITSKMPGRAWEHATLSPEQKQQAARDLGDLVLRIHRLDPPHQTATQADWPIESVSAACKRSSLPAHLVEQIDGFISQLEPFDHAFVHGDIMHRHAFIADGALSGIIDWGDAMVIDRHYELAKLHLDLFDCDKTLLREFLYASRWPLAANFARQALGLALYRQAIGLVQHNSMDVFYKIPGLLPLNEIETLNELSEKLFAV